MGKVTISWRKADNTIGKKIVDTSEILKLKESDKKEEIINGKEKDTRNKEKRYKSGGKRKSKD